MIIAIGQFNVVLTINGCQSRAVHSRCECNNNGLSLSGCRRMNGDSPALSCLGTDDIIVLCLTSISGKCSCSCFDFRISRCVEGQACTHGISHNDIFVCISRNCDFHLIVNSVANFYVDGIVSVGFRSSRIFLLFVNCRIAVLFVYSDISCSSDKVLAGLTLQQVIAFRKI